MPYEHLQNKVLIDDAKRLIELGWSNRIIADVLRRTYAIKITAQCVNGCVCSGSCPQWCR